MEVFSARLKWLRENSGMTQKQVADLINMSQPGYTKIENGTREPNLDVLRLIRLTFDEDLDFLLGITEMHKGNEQLFIDIRRYIRILENANKLIEGAQLDPINIDYSNYPDITTPAEFVKVQQRRIVNIRTHLKRVATALYANLTTVPMVREEALNFCLKWSEITIEDS